jgi:membrane associated rhomboid family serine protease
MSEVRFTRPDNFPPVVKNLIIINVLVFLGQLFLKQYYVTEKLMLWPVMPHRLHEILVQQNVIDATDKFNPYQIITHLFAHSPTMFFHIILNMLVLWMFGRVLESVWGSKRFLLFYILSGIGAAALHLLIQYYRCTELLHALDANDMDAAVKLIGGTAPALGASGAIMGVMVGFAYLFPNTELYIMLIPFPVKAKWAVTGYVLIDLLAGTFNATGDNIAHFAHLGGALTGFLIVFIWNKTNRKTLY